MPSPSPATVDPVPGSGSAGTAEPSADRSSRNWAVAALGCLAALVATLGGALAQGSANQAGWTLFALLALAWVEFGVGCLAVRRASPRTGVVLVVAGGLALQLTAVAFPPRLTDDYFRYAWDGRVQAAGIDPYRYAPVDPALSRLRDPWLFPAGCADSSPPCTRMNHPTDPTIYPPVAEAAFLVVHVITRPLGDAGGADLTWQLLGAALGTCTTLTLLRILRRRGDPRQAVLWAWCPTVTLECGNNGHVDALAALLVVLGLGAAASGHRARAGAALGAAVATKILPVLVLPALLAPATSGGVRRQARLVGAALLVVVVTYLPHLAAVGTGVLGFLPGYLTEEGYQGHSRYGLLRLLLPDAVATGVAAIALVVVAAAVARRTDPSRPWEGALPLVGVAFVLGGITYPWYALLLVALVALDGRREWLAVAAAAYPGYLTTALHLPWTPTQQSSYGAATAVLLLGGLARRRGAGGGPRRDGGPRDSSRCRRGRGGASDIHAP